MLSITMSLTSTAVVEVTTLHLTPSLESHNDVPPNSATERERATLRFTAAQKLFNNQAAAQAKSQSSTSISRQRTNTGASLYTKLDASVTDKLSSVEEPGVSSSPSDLSFTNAFMKIRARQAPRPTPATSLASSESPPTPVNEGCILLGPRRALLPLDVTRQIQATTTCGLPAWYCRHDKLVIFDGVRENNENGAPKLITRSSRGLDMARRNCPKTTINVDVPCSHCQDLLKRKTWVFEERMLECSVCKACQDRCWYEWEKRNKSVHSAVNTFAVISLPITPPPSVTGEFNQDTVDVSAPCAELNTEDTKLPEPGVVLPLDPDLQDSTN